MPYSALSVRDDTARVGTHRGDTARARTPRDDTARVGGIQKEMTQPELEHSEMT